MGRTNLDTAAYLGMRQWFALDQQIRDARNSGLYVCSGGAIVPSATAGKLKVVGATVDFVSTTELNVAAIDPINFLTALPGGAADASNPMSYADSTCFDCSSGSPRTYLRPRQRDCC